MNLRLLILLVLFMSACGGESRQADTPDANIPPMNIDEVIDKHAPSLMKIDGVVGVYHGLGADSADCVVVMIASDSERVRGEIPSSISGFPVRLEVSGQIVPMGRGMDSTRPKK